MNTSIAIAVAICGLLVAAPASAEEDGAGLFLRKCAACHQADGSGLPNPIPPLAGSPVLLDEDAAVVARLILTGKAGMPQFHYFLDNKQIAAILTYARGAWGNSAGPITAETVESVRKQLGDDGVRMIRN